MAANVTDLPAHDAVLLNNNVEGVKVLLEENPHLLADIPNLVERARSAQAVRALLQIDSFKRSNRVQKLKLLILSLNLIAKF